MMFGSSLLTLPFVAAFLCALVLGTVLHELTHAVVAKAAGARVRFEWPPAVVYALDESTPRWVDRIINLAPQMVGFGVAIAWYATRGLPEGQAGLAIIAGWLMYVWGSLEDLSYAKAHGEAAWIEVWWAGLSRQHQDLVLAGTGATVTIAMSLGWPFMQNRLGATLHYLTIIPALWTTYFLWRPLMEEARQDSRSNDDCETDTEATS